MAKYLVVGFYSDNNQVWSGTVEDVESPDCAAAQSVREIIFANGWDEKTGGELIQVVEVIDLASGSCVSGHDKVRSGDEVLETEKMS